MISDIGSPGPYYTHYSTDEWNISLHGDDLERKQSQFIFSKLPAYAQVWGKFIGRQPSGAAAELLVSSTNTKHPPKDFQETRLLYTQHHYSILASFDGMIRRLDIVIDTSIDQIIDNVILFHAYMGRVRDSLKRGAETIGLANELSSYTWWAKLQGVYARRSVVIHGPHPPLLFNGYEYKISKPSDGTEPGWDDHTGLWSDPKRYESLIDYYDSRINELTPLAQSGLSAFLGRITDMMKESGCYLEAPDWYDKTRYGRSGVEGLPQGEGISGGYGISSTDHS